MKLNLGCSDDIRPGFVNVDLLRPPNADDSFAQIDLSAINGWPWPDSSVDMIRAHDVFEHIDNAMYPADKGIIFAMNEAWRVLRPGGILDLVVPCLPGDAPYVDPTHVQVWTGSTRYYFDEAFNNPRGERGRLGDAYGITARFKTLDCWSKSSDPLGPWLPVNYAKDRNKLFLLLEAVK